MTRKRKEQPTDWEKLLEMFNRTYQERWEDFQSFMWIIEERLNGRDFHIRPEHEAKLRFRSVIAAVYQKYNKSNGVVTWEEIQSTVNN